MLRFIIQEAYKDAGKVRITAEANKIVRELNVSVAENLNDSNNQSEVRGSENEDYKKNSKERR